MTKKNLLLPNSPLGKLAISEQQREAREREALAVYRPMPTQEAWHRSFATERLAVGGKRSGKTTMVASHFAAVVTDRPLMGMDGKEIPIRRPKPNSEWTFWVIGWDQAHIGQTIYRVLFKPNLFRVIKDKQTGKYRTYNDAMMGDSVRILESLPAEPLIPERFHAAEHAWSFEEKSAGVFKSCRLEFINRAGNKQVSMIYAFPSTQPQAKQGDPVDGIYIDEDIRFPQHYEEWQDRLADRGGQIWWSAWPHLTNDALLNLHHKAEAEREAGVEEPSVFEIALVMSQNPYLTQKNREEALGRMDSDEARASRDRGEFNFDSVKLYDFSKYAHGIMSDENSIDPLEKIWTSDGRFPQAWTRFISIDPSYTRTAVLFGVVPPEYDFGKRLIIEDELVLKRAGCDECAKQVKAKCDGKGPFEWFVIDQQAGKQHGIGQTERTMDQYQEAFARVGLKSRLTRSGFLHGSNDITGRQGMVRSLMYDDGMLNTSKLRVVLEKCPNLTKELRDTKRRVTKDGVDEKVAGKMHDCFDAETEVLTENGWQYFRDYTANPNCTLATVNLGTDAIEYHKPLRVIAKEHHGEMIQFGGTKLNALVTPSHRMVVRNRLHHDVSIAEAQSLAKSQHQIKLHATWHGEQANVVLVPRVANGNRVASLEKEIDPGLFAEFLGWYVAEGSVSKRVKCPGWGYRIVVSQNPGQKRDILRSLLSQLPWKWTEQKVGFSCSSKQLWTYLMPLGTKYEKYVPSWIKWSKPEVIRRFVIGAVLGDGWTQGTSESYCTVSRKLADDMQELYIKLGQAASVRIRPSSECQGMIKGREVNSKHDQYWVHRWINPIGDLCDRKYRPNFHPVKYDGMVYCATVPNGTLIVRRHGKPMIAGNCIDALEYMVAAQPQYVDPSLHTPERSQVYQLAQNMKAQAERQSELTGQGVHFGPGSGVAA